MHRLDCITELLSYGHNIGLILAYGIMEVAMFWQRNNLKEILREIDEMENELFNEINQQNGSKKFQLFYITGIWLIFSSVNFSYLTYFLTGAEVMPICYKCIISLYVVAIEMKFLEYRLYVQIICHLMEGICIALERIKSQMEQFRRPEHERLPYFMIQQLLRNQQLLNRLWLMVYKVNVYFALPLALVCCQNGIAILFTVNWAYVRSLFEHGETNQIFRFVYIILLLLNIVYICNYTEKCMKKYHSLSTVLNNFKLHPQDIEVRMHLREYSLQLMHQKLKFTCNYFLDIDYKTLGKIILAVTSFMIILIQFKMTNGTTGAIVATQRIFGFGKLKL
ncbi:putative gustatory receptor 98b [Musca vetustissima]|uniref:putative gustatory receptor 98b n=1 Tax=Musca vetustissima TaxID=27455 RepID=UPI002AB7A8AA|nr:putative gustatory receptor 98b [Musca vetustissima]